MTPARSCQRCGCTQPEGANCPSCRHPRSLTGAAPEHLFCPPTGGRRDVARTVTDHRS